jgi:hypothetical protein
MKTPTDINNIPSAEALAVATVVNIDPDHAAYVGYYHLACSAHSLQKILSTSDSRAVVEILERLRRKIEKSESRPKFELVRSSANAAR